MYTVVQLNSASTGGLGRLSRDISDTLNKHQITNYIAYGRGKIFDPNRDFMFGKKEEILSHAVLTRITDKAGLYSRKGTKELLKFLDKTQPDILHLHNIHGYYINYEMLFDYIKQNNICTIWTLHDCWSFTGHCTHFTAVQCHQWKNGCVNCPQLLKYPKCYTNGNVKANYERKKSAFTGVENMLIVTPSVWLSALVKESFLKEYQTVVINNGIDISMFRPKENVNLARFGIPKDKTIVLGLASTWGERKGELDFYKLASILPEDHVIVMVGLNKKQCKQIPSGVIGIEHTETAEDLVDLYNAADIFFNPTYEDNFPTTNIEALACGTPVLTYRTGGSPEVINDINGYVIQQGDLKEAKKIILVNVKNEQRIKACRESAKCYDRTNQFEKYVSLYNRLLNEGE